MITGLNELITLAKHVSWKCKCRFDQRNYNSDKWWNNDKCQCECKNCVWNPATCICENWNYLASIMDDSAIIWDEIMVSYNEEIKTTPTSFNEKKATCKTQGFYILLSFLLITIALLIAVSITSYLIKYRKKLKHWLPFHFTNNKTKM